MFNKLLSKFDGNTPLSIFRNVFRKREWHFITATGDPKEEVKPEYEILYLFHGRNKNDGVGA